MQNRDVNSARRQKPRVVVSEKTVRQWVGHVLDEAGKKSWSNSKKGKQMNKLAAQYETPGVDFGLEDEIESAVKEEPQLTDTDKAVLISGMLSEADPERGIAKMSRDQLKSHTLSGMLDIVREKLALTFEPETVDILIHDLSNATYKSEIFAAFNDYATQISGRSPSGGLSDQQLRDFALADTEQTEEEGDIDIDALVQDVDDAEQAQEPSAKHNKEVDRTASEKALKAMNVSPDALKRSDDPFSEENRAALRASFNQPAGMSGVGATRRQTPATSKIPDHEKLPARERHVDRDEFETGWDTPEQIKKRAARHIDQYGATPGGEFRGPQNYKRVNDDQKEYVYDDSGTGKPKRISDKKVMDLTAIDAAIHDKAVEIERNNDRQEFDPVTLEPYGPSVTWTQDELPSSPKSFIGARNKRKQMLQVLNRLRQEHPNLTDKERRRAAEAEVFRASGETVAGKDLAISLDKLAMRERTPEFVLEMFHFAIQKYKDVLEEPMQIVRMGAEEFINDLVLLDSDDTKEKLRFTDDEIKTLKREPAHALKMTDFVVWFDKWTKSVDELKIDAREMGQNPSRYEGVTTADKKTRAYIKSANSELIQSALDIALNAGTFDLNNKVKFRGRLDPYIGSDPETGKKAVLRGKFTYNFAEWLGLLTARNTQYEGPSFTLVDAHIMRDPNFRYWLESNSRWHFWDWTRNNAERTPAGSAPSSYGPRRPDSKSYSAQQSVRRVPTED